MVVDDTIASDPDDGAGPLYAGLRRRPPGLGRRVQIALVSTVVVGGLVAGSVMLGLAPTGNNPITLPPSAAPLVSPTEYSIPVPDPAPSSANPSASVVQSASATATVPAPPPSVAPPRPPHTVTTAYQAESSANTRPGTSLRWGGVIVGDILGSATLTVNGITAAGDDTYEITIYYSSGMDQPRRSATILVNGVVTTSMTFEWTATWEPRDVRPTGPIQLNLRAGANSITIANSGGYAPDIDKIEVR